MNYTAEIQHSETTFRRLSKVQHNEYGKPLKLTMSAMGLVALLIGLSSGFSSTPAIIMLFVGCWIFTSLNLPAQRNAEKLIELAAGDFPRTRYQFLSNEIRLTSEDSSGDITTTLDYRKIYDILEDKEYLYLFLSRSAGYMIPKASVRPADLSSFIAFLEEKIGLQRHAVTNMLSANLHTVLKQRKARKARSQQQ